MKLRAKVVAATGFCDHRVATICNDEVVPTESIPEPALVEITQSEDGTFFLLRLDYNNKCLADTWHPTLQDAKAQAFEEYSIAEGDWHPVE